jgi:hypothetical protein
VKHRVLAATQFYFGESKTATCFAFLVDAAGDDR